MEGTFWLLSEKVREILFGSSQNYQTYQVCPVAFTPNLSNGFFPSPFVESSLCQGSCFFISNRSRFFQPKPDYRTFDGLVLLRVPSTFGGVHISWYQNISFYSQVCLSQLLMRTSHPWLLHHLYHLRMVIFHLTCKRKHIKDQLHEVMLNKSTTR